VTDLVAGEAVVLEMRLARLASRGLALALDLAVQVAVLVAGSFLVFGVALGVDDALGAAIVLTYYVAVVLGYPVALETLTRGRSLGKMAFGLRVVRDDGGPIRFRHALVRGLLGVVEFWVLFGSLPLITSLASSRGKRVGDLLAGTVVVRERVPVGGAAMAAMPPPLAGWAATLDLTRVPDDLALAARQFLSRASQLAPQVRAEMGGRLAAAVAGVTSPPPPPGVPPEPYLSAVLAERRRRETMRLQPAYGDAPRTAPPPGAPPAAAPVMAPQPVAQPPAPAPPVPAPPSPSPAGAERREGGFAPPG
jgi:uncharacterized RDD family membrane protein YckC